MNDFELVLSVGVALSDEKEKSTPVAEKVTTTFMPTSLKPTAGDVCPDVITYIASHDTGKARVNLALSKGSLQTLELPVGTYSYNLNRGDRICKLNVKVIGKGTQCSAHLVNRSHLLSATATKPT